MSIKLGDAWRGCGDTALLKKEIVSRGEMAKQKLVASAGCSSDPKCAELAREIRTYEQMLKLLEGEKNDERSD